MSATDLFGFSEDDIAMLFDDDSIVQDTGESQNAALQELSRQISGQYVDVLAAYAGSAFGGRASAARSQVDAALDALMRLAVASEDSDLVTCLAELAALLPMAEEEGARKRQQFMGQMREWVLRFADLLGIDDAARMRHLVTVDRSANPLLDELANIRGIGPKRLERLYCAGLFSVSVISQADPVDVAHVTGIPSKLAEDVVAATLDYATRCRAETLEGLTRRAIETRELVERVRRNGGPRPQVLDGVKQAFLELQKALEMLEMDANGGVQ